jgi:hypothetical protein
LLDALRPLRVAIAQRVQKVTAFFNQLKKDFQAAGITFSGVDLRDMQQHAQFAKLKIFNAWTNSATEIYVNIDDGFSKLATKLGDKRMAELIYATVVVRHELHHVKQFKNTGGPPTAIMTCASSRETPMRTLPNGWRPTARC